MMKQGFATAINQFIVVVFDLFLLDLCVEIKHITSLGVPMNFHHEGSPIRKQFSHFILHLVKCDSQILSLYLHSSLKCFPLNISHMEIFFCV